MENDGLRIQSPLCPDCDRWDGRPARASRCYRARVTPVADFTASLRSVWGLEEPRLGLALGGAHRPEQVADHLAWAQRAERLGLHSVWLPEMHFVSGGCPAPLVELAALASQTRHIRLGTTSLLLPLHPPAALAGQIAALDRISRGRLLIGTGRGFRRPMLEAFGVDPASKRGRFDECLDGILAHWNEGNTRGGVLATHQQPHPPLAVAAFGPKGLAQAARRGLPYLASPVETWDQIDQNQATHRALLPDPEQEGLSLVMRTVFVSEEARMLQAAREGLRAERSGGRLGMPEVLRAAFDAPLETRAIVGTPDGVREALGQACARLDVDLLIVRPQIPGLPPAAIERSLEILAESIWPGLCSERSIARKSKAASTTRPGRDGC